jgi:hypothetical protein
MNLKNHSRITQWGFDGIFNTCPIHHIGVRIKGRLVGSRLQVQNKVRDKII